MSVWGGGGGGGALGSKMFSIILGLIYVGTCYTRGARSRRWFGWWGRSGALGNELELRHGWLEI